MLAVMALDVMLLSCGRVVVPGLGEELTGTSEQHGPRLRNRFEHCQQFATSRFMKAQGRVQATSRGGLWPPTFLNHRTGLQDFGRFFTNIK